MEKINIKFGRVGKFMAFIVLIIAMVCIITGSNQTQEEVSHAIS